MTLQAKAIAAGVVLVAWLASVGAASWFAFGLGEDRCTARHAKDAELIERAGQAFEQRAAQAISRIEVQRVEITQPVLREVRERTVYRDCKHSPDGLRGVNAALTGRAQPAGGGAVPPASAPGR